MKYLFMFLVALLTACSVPVGDLTPSPSNLPPTATETLTVVATRAEISPTPDLTATAIASWTPAPTPTPEERDDNFGFRWYRVLRNVNVREYAGIEFPILTVLFAPNYALVYDTTLDYGGYRWGWVLDDCNGLLDATGWSAIRSDGGTVWLELDAQFNPVNCK